MSQVTSKGAAISQTIKMTLVLGTVLTVINQWSELMAGAMVQWIPTVLTYVVIFAAIYGYNRLNQKNLDAGESSDEVMGTVSPQHINALYKQSMIVERNAHKANAAFNNQLNTIHALIERTQKLDNAEDFEQSHGELLKELRQLEMRISNIVKEMEKNVKLGEKLQQSVANIDPEIGIY